MPKFAFQFIAGKYEGGSYVLPDEGEVILGRATDVEVVLIEDMVSRRHAQLTCARDRLILRDLGSTNGTFVNGERIKTCELELQDRVLVGTSMLRLVEAERVARHAADVNLKATLVGSLPGAGPDVGADAGGAAHQGDLAQKDLRRVLLDLEAERASGTLELTLGDDTAVLRLHEGTLVDAALQSDDKVRPLNALRHVLTWTYGRWRLRRTATATLDTRSFAEPTARTVAEALRQNAVSRERYEHTWRDAPAVALRRPLGGRLAALSPASLDVLQLVLDWQTIEAILEHAHHDDYALLLALDELVAQGILQPGAHS